MFKKNNFSVFLFYLIASIFFTGLLIGFKNLFFTETSWILGSGDKTNAHIAWTFFRNDIWHFPIGKNPNYGLDIANSIIFTDSIPVFAIIFKFFSFFLPDNFQYFSLWIMLCFFLQMYCSYLLVIFFTQDFKFSILSSLLIALLPFFLFRLEYHPSLGAHWLLLMAFYINFAVPKEKKEIYWFFLILISLLIHLYFTAMLMIIYTVHNFKYLINKNNYKSIFKEYFLILLSVIFVMFVSGYFLSNPINSMSTGYGVYKADLLSILDPAFNGSTKWSYFIKDLWPSSIEGFNYVGLGIILLYFFSTLVLLKNFQKKKIKKNFKDNYEYIFLIIFFSLWAITTNFTVAGIEIFNISLNKYFYGLLSIFAATGRFFWPVIYLVTIFSILLVFKYFKNNKKYYLIIFLICMQMIDIYPKIKLNLTEKNSTNDLTRNFEDNIWETISTKFKKLRTTYLYNNYGPIFEKLSHFIYSPRVKSTDIILNASMNRVNAAQARYKLIDLVNKGRIPNDTAYIVDNLGHLRHLKYIFSNKDVGFFYRNNFWIMLPNQKKMMSKEDIKRINQLKFNSIKVDKTYQIKFNEKNSFLGFGWSHNFSDDGVWSEGNTSTLILNLEKFKEKQYKFVAEIEKYLVNNNKNYQIEIFINKKLIKKINLNDPKNYQNLEFVIENKNIQNLIIIDFKFKGLISPYDRMINPDARKLGILLKNFYMSELK